MENDDCMKPLKEVIRRNCPPMAPIATGNEPQLNKIDGVKAVLFDVYGTLFISGSGDVGTAAATDTAEALTQALVVSGFEGELEQAGAIGKDMLKTEILEWHKAGHDAGVDYPEVEITKVWKTIIDTLCNTETLTTVAPDLDMIRRLSLEYECRVNPAYPMPGSIETLTRLKEREHILGIVSNASFYTPLLFSAFFEQSVEDCGFDPDCCIWSYKELKAKPSKALFPKAGKFLKEKYNISLNETVYVGNDMLNDIYCAKIAGCKTVLFAGDQRSLRLRENDERCLAITPDAVITSLPQLMEII
jgi:putative hydrolase of the HAD superfamily